jgi:hypothetical protein
MRWACRAFAGYRTVIDGPAIEAALIERMPLNEIQEYLDWLDSRRAGGSKLECAETQLD